MVTHKERARGALTGLAIGDALGAPTEGYSPEYINQKWGRITGFINENQHGSDDTEYALFSAGLLLRYSESLTAEIVADAWRKDIINPNNAYKGAGFSEIIAIRNLANGIQPPLSGKHLHSWSDGLAMRAAPFGIVFCGDPDAAAEYVKRDGEVSHSGEGIYGGQAVAAAVAIAMKGAGLDEIVNAALKVIPQKSWTYSIIKKAVEIGGDSPDVWSSLKPLYEEICVKNYFWADLAPEAVGLAFGIIMASKNSFTDAVLGGVNIGRDTDTIAAIAGSVVGAKNGIGCIPSEWKERITLAKGVCIAAVKDVDILVTADKLAELSESRIIDKRV